MSDANRWPDGQAFVVQSKREGAQKWTNEGTFVVDNANGYPYGQAAADANALHTSLYVNHTGGPADYVWMLCTLQGWESRPVA